MWTGEIREWTIRGGELDGRIYNSNNCRWTNWEYPNGAFIGIHIYHYPNFNRIECISTSERDGSVAYQAYNNYMHLTLGKEWYYDLKQTGTWNPCPLHFKLILDKEPHKHFLYQAGCLVSIRPWGRELFSEKDMTIIDDDQDPDKEAEVISHPKLSIISGGKDNTGNWLINLKEGSVFLCRHKKKSPTGDEDFILIQFHIKKKWAMAVWIHSNFPMHQAGDYFVHSLKFSQQHELIDLLQDGEPDGFGRQDEEDGS